MPKFESAIQKTYRPAEGAAISIADESFVAKTLVRSDQPQFGLTFGHSAVVGDALVAATRPDEWLILGAQNAVALAEQSVDRDGFTNVISFTHGRSLFRITGGPARSLLEKVCGIDWSNPMTPNGAVVSASVALVTCDIIRNDQEQLSYLLQCDRSFGQYLFDALIDAGDEFGVTTLLA